MSAIFPLSLGTVTFLSNICFLVVQKALLGRYFTVGHLMQIPAVFLFGLFIDGWMWATSYLVTDVYWQQMLMCLVGSMVLGLGVSLEIISNATVLPGEGMVVAIVFRTHKNFGNIKVLVDSSMVLAAVLLREFAVSGMRLVAVEKGRVIAAAWSGKVKTASTMVCICLMLFGIPHWLNLVCQAVILVTTVYSGVEYFVKNWDVFRES